MVSLLCSSLYAPVRPSIVMRSSMYFFKWYLQEAVQCNSVMSQFSSLIVNFCFHIVCFVGEPFTSLGYLDLLSNAPFITVTVAIELWHLFWQLLSSHFPCLQESLHLLPASYNETLVRTVSSQNFPNISQENKRGFILEQLIINFVNFSRPKEEEEYKF